MLVVNTKEIFLLNLHQNRVHFPAERNAFVLDHQHGCHDVTCKPAILLCQVRTGFDMIADDRAIVKKCYMRSSVIGSLRMQTFPVGPGFQMFATKCLKIIKTIA